MKKRYLITIEYDGKNYCGWQRQSNGTSVQAVVEEKLSELFGGAVTLFGSGRTDAGVSAFAQTAHFDAETDIPNERLIHAINFLLPRDIAVLDCRTVSDDFHARFNRKKKTYVYKIYVSPVRRPLFDRERLFVRKNLDLSAMKKAAEFMTGTYDCRCYEKAGSANGNPVKTIYSVSVLDFFWSGMIDTGRGTPNIGNGMVNIDSGTSDIGNGMLNIKNGTPNIESGMVNIDSGTSGIGNGMLNMKNGMPNIGNGTSDIKCGTIDIEVAGSGFLYKMVRTMAGTLLYAGLGKLTPVDVLDAVKNCGKTKIGKTLPAEFLYLTKTEYF
ncbi:MAG: tRNA pseudouridine(38-40) synthase TruA [Clostridiales bacterium]|jgi:tRNA pseudouridine38-40 synthase|nr:tRNA pseudouridine(38-40) synthase TruA [Clostridiales bacterium]